MFFSKTESSMQLYLSRDARLTESLGQMVNVGLIAEGEPSNMLRKGVFRIDLHQLAPDPARFRDFAQMAERDSKKGAREVGRRDELDTLLEQRRGSFEFVCHKIGRAEKVDVWLIRRGIEPDGLLDMGNSGEGLWPSLLIRAPLVRSTTARSTNALAGAGATSETEAEGQYRCSSIC
jgi:hypothetical protein